jgi:ABC-type dipeptide/oligopeptide/nickel transport system ATPase component
MALMLITHDFGVVAGMVERVNVMYRGEIVETGEVERVFSEPQHAYTRELLNAVPRLDRIGRAQ